MEKYFDTLDGFAKWAATHQIVSISIDAHKCLSVNGSVRYGLSCIATGSTAEKPFRGQFNTIKFNDQKLIDQEAEKLESTLRSYGFAVDRLILPV